MRMRRVKNSDIEYPEVFKNLPQPPKELFIIGADLNDLLKRPVVSIVGSRKVTPYGRTVTEQLAGDLARAGVVIVSGLALGVDSIAHQAALEINGLTIAVLPTGLENIYPRSHYFLAKSILEKGGALISEYSSSEAPRRENFIARNRLIATLGQGVLITEAAEKSGSLHTARFALEQGIEVLAVPGNITNSNSQGTNNLIKAGARVVTNTNDVFSNLNIQPTGQIQLPLGANAEEQLILDLLRQGVDEVDILLDRSGLATDQFNQTLTMLEISGNIHPIGAGRWTIR